MFRFTHSVIIAYVTMQVHARRSVVRIACQQLSVATKRYREYVPSRFSTCSLLECNYECFVAFCARCVCIYDLSWSFAWRSTTSLDEMISRCWYRERIAYVSLSVTKNLWLNPRYVIVFSGYVLCTLKLYTEGIHWSSILLKFEN